jgi:2'-5' RNA ligase
MRAFLALPVPEEIQSAFRPFLKEGKRIFPEVKWVRPENLHITLLFLGEIDGAAEEKISACCEKTAEIFSPFTVGFGGLWQFFPKGAPRVLFAPVNRRKQECSGIYNDLRLRTAELLPPDSRPYHPHITLGRIKRGKKVRAVGDTEFTDTVRGEYVVDRIILFQSVLQSDGPVYNERTSFALQS